MPNLFGVDLQALFATAIGGQLYDATVVKKTPGAYNPADPTAGTNPSSATYTCKGVPTKVQHEFIAGDQTRHITGEVLIMLGTMSTLGIQPAPGDIITIVKPGTTTNVVGTIIEKGVSIDPAGATAMCKVRG
jgi:hypothetical protein